MAAALCGTVLSDVNRFTSEVSLRDPLEGSPDPRFNFNKVESGSNLEQPAGQLLAAACCSFMKLIDLKLAWDGVHHWPVLLCV